MKTRIKANSIRSYSFLTGLAFAFSFFPLQQLKAESEVATGKVNAQYTILQDKTVKGTVVDENGVSLIGVSIQVKGTSSGTITDFDGNFSLDASPQSELVFSYVGYKTLYLQAGKVSGIIKLVPDTEALDEIVVVGYGVVKKRDLTGAVASVKNEDIVLSPTGNVMEALQGKVSGLDITRADGRAGSKVNMTLRGNRSINGSNTPLFIIDGMEGDYEDINPNDIESVEVLKDASSTAIYGSAGANGVVIITTKKGRVGKPQINFDAYVGINGFTQFPEVRSGQDYINLRREAYRAAGEWASEADDSRIFSNAEWDAIQNNQWTDWFDEATRNGIQQNYSLSFNGGTENTKSYFSVNYYNEDGILKNDDITRYSLRANIDHKVTSWLKGGVNLQATYSDANTRKGQIYTRALSLSPFGEPYDENGKVNTFPLVGEEGTLSPIADMADDQYVNNKHTLGLAPNVYLELTPLKGLSIKTVLGAYLRFSRQGVYKGLYSADGYGDNKSSAQLVNGNTYNYKWENILNYTIKIGGNHDLTFTGVTSWAKNQKEESSSIGYNIDWDKYVFHHLQASSANDRVITSDYKRNQVMSYIARINYSLFGRYLFSISNRWDGASILAAGHQWSSFPAAAVAWRISDESFMRKFDNLSNLKLRVGYGVTGNAGASEYATQTFGYGDSNFAFQDSSAPYYIFSATLANKALTWEKSYNTNIGVDVGLFNNRLNITADFYTTKTEDILFKRSLPASIGGFKGSNYNIWQNVCATSNKGLELAVNSRNIVRENFVWSSNLTFAMNREEITELTSDDPVVNGDYYLIKGEPINSFYNYKYEGIWQLGEEEAAAKVGCKPGDIKLYNKTEDGKYDAKDYTVLGSPNPDWTLGFQNTFNFFHFDFSFFVQARWGQMIEHGILGWYNPSGKDNGPAICDYWTPENPSGRFPRPYKDLRFTNYTGYQSLMYIDGSYIKIKNITLGYSIPERILKKAGISRARLYATVSNPFVFSKNKLLKNYDPERGGADEFPLTKQMVFGVNVSF